MADDDFTAELEGPMTPDLLRRMGESHARKMAAEQSVRRDHGEPLRRAQDDSSTIDNLIVAMAQVLHQRLAEERSRTDKELIELRNTVADLKAKIDEREQPREAPVLRIAG